MTNSGWAQSASKPTPVDSSEMDFSSMALGGHKKREKEDSALWAIHDERHPRRTKSPHES